MKSYDWSKLQRQPLAGLTIAFINVLWQMVKGLWPFVILMLVRNKPGKVDKYEIIALVFVAVTIIGAVARFFFFRFYIEADKLIIKKGWLKKETQIIPLEKIQTVNIEQGPVHQALNIVKLTIDTAGSQKAEAKIDALHKVMAEALRERLLTGQQNKDQAQVDTATPARPIVQLSGKDLLKLSLSANHLETLLLIFSFVFGLYDNFKEINTGLFEEVEDQLPRQSIYPVLFLIAAILIITIVVSTARIFFTFYDFKAVQSNNGFQIKSGLLNVKERLIHFPKIQFVSWKANWIRKKLQLWMMEYHISGADEMQKKSRVQLPLTRDEFIPLLADAYYPMPVITNEKYIQIHPSFFWRRLVIVGLLPSFIIIPLLWLIGQEKALFFLIYPIIIGSIAYLTQKKFRLWALQDVAFIKKGWLGETGILFRWHKLQSVQLKQSLFQKRKGLASVQIQTAAGSINIPFIALEAAQQVCNYALYKCESEKHSWM